MTRRAAKENELRDVLDTIKLLPLDVAEAPIEGEEGKEPDFRLVLTDGRRIGLEHTRARDNNLAPAGAVQQRIQRAILARLAAAGVDVRFRLPPATAAFLNSQPDATEAVIAAIVDIARDYIATNPGDDWQKWEPLDDDIDYGNGMVERDLRRDQGVHDLRDRGIQHVTFVAVRRRSPSCVIWGHQTNRQSDRIIQDAINHKSNKLEVYRQAGDHAQWLLVVGSTGPGGELDID